MNKYVILDEIQKIRKNLSTTDYVTNKLTEAAVKYLIYGDKTALEITYLEYKLILDQRQAWRDEINRLENQLKEIANEGN